MRTPIPRRNTPLNILIVDDHALFREGLRLLLTRLAPAVSVVEAGTVEAALTRAKDDIDLVLLDVNLPGCRGLDSLHAVRTHYPNSAVVLLSGVDAPGLIRDGFASGARGFIHKSVTADAMLAAVSDVLAGGTCRVTASDFPAIPAGTDASAPLTPRQRDVLERLCQGMSNKEIGRSLGMSENTVRVHIAGIFRMLGARSRTEAALLARRHGLAA